MLDVVCIIIYMKVGVKGANILHLHQSNFLSRFFLFHGLLVWPLDTSLLDVVCIIIYTMKAGIKGANIGIAKYSENAFSLFTCKLIYT